jgi:hypothetical protein
MSDFPRIAFVGFCMSGLIFCASLSHFHIVVLLQYFLVKLCAKTECEEMHPKAELEMGFGAGLSDENLTSALISIDSNRMSDAWHGFERVAVFVALVVDCSGG